MKYVVYDPSTGEIVVSGEVAGIPDDHGLGTLLQDVDGDFWTHYVRGGSLVAYTPAQAVAKAARPEYPAAWSNTAMAWQDQRSLAQARVDQWELVKAARDAAMLAGFTWNGARFDADEVSQQRIQGAVQLAVLAAQAGQSFSVNWTLFDNSTLVLSGSDMLGVGMALGAFVQQAFATGVSLRTQINNATTLEQIKAAVWPS